MTMADGTIKMIAGDRTGLIHPNWGDADLPFRHTDLHGVAFEQLRRGDQVTYTARTVPGRTRWYATAIRPWRR